MLIEISGIDGSGKTTLMHALRSFLAGHRVECQELVLRSTAKRVLDDVARNCGKRNWRQMFTAEEVETSHAIEMLGQVHGAIGLLAEDQVLVTDTYVARWLATAARWEAGHLERLALVYARFPAPAVSFHLSLPTEDAYQRLMARPKGDRLMSEDDGLRKLARYAAAFTRASPLLPYQQVRLSAVPQVTEILDEMVRVLRARTALGSRVTADARFPTT